MVNEIEVFNLNRKSYIQIGLTIGLIAAFVLLALTFTANLFLWGSTVAVALFVILLLLVNTTDRDSEQEEGQLGELEIESEALTDSRICEKETSFIGIPIILVFGRLWGKYESIFSIEHDGSAVVVLYPAYALFQGTINSGLWENGTVEKKLELKAVLLWPAGLRI